MRFELFLVNHSHIDIGYTERQEKIAEYQALFIKQAVESALSPKQFNRADDERFKFTCEGFWAVEQYLMRYGDEGYERFICAIKNGFIELTACCCHMSELLDMGHLSESVGFAADFAKEYGFMLDSAMASDINGFSWGMADALAERGVRYLISNINPHHGGAPLGKPLIPFYWESPKRKKILVWNGLAYHKANLLGLMPGFMPVSDPGIPGMVVNDMGFADIQDISIAEKRIFELVKGLRDQGYPYDFLPIMGSGLYTDNSPTSDDFCDLVHNWNKKHGDVYIYVFPASVNFSTILRIDAAICQLMAVTGTTGGQMGL